MVMGPTAGMVLADLGADVIKIEPTPTGDSTRRLTGSGTGFYASFQRNRRSLCVDIKAPEGLALVKSLLGGSDAVIENFRPGAMDKLGLDYASLSAINPGLIYCSCKGFLPGPYEHRTALDEVVQMMGGLAFMTGLEGRPLRAGASVIDIMGGLSAAIAILAVVAERAQTGRGRHVQAALFETVAMLMSQHMAQAAITGTAPPPMSTRTPAWPVYDVFETSDGGQVFVGVVTDTAWPAFCDAFGLHALTTDPSLATKQQRVAERHRTIPAVAEALRHFTKDAPAGAAYPRTQGGMVCDELKAPGRLEAYARATVAAAGGGCRHRLDGEHRLVRRTDPSRHPALRDHGTAPRSRDGDRAGHAGGERRGRLDSQRRRRLGKRRRRTALRARDGAHRARDAAWALVSQRPRHAG
jgi:crotonobetainyl-CoA:carnitine CoA-transferase CaiB-like acyl-CoA transferase